MEAFQDRRVVLGVGLGAFVLLMLLVGVYAGGLAGRRKTAAPAGPRASLQVQMGETGSAKLDPKAPLRCFVNGRFVGTATLADCARRNGVDPGRMDVGVDASGQVAAAGEGQAELAALPEEPAAAVQPAEPVQPPAQPGAARGACLRYAGGEWREAGVGLTLRACARTLFEGRCVRPGEALYGRYGERTLRLVPGRVESSGDDRSFSPVMGQDPDACALDG